ICIRSTVPPNGVEPWRTSLLFGYSAVSLCDLSIFGANIGALFKSTSIRQQSQLSVMQPGPSQRQCHFRSLRFSYQQLTLYTLSGFQRVDISYGQISGSGDRVAFAQRESCKRPQELCKSQECAGKAQYAFSVK